MGAAIWDETSHEEIRFNSRISLIGEDYEGQEVTPGQFVKDPFEVNPDQMFSAVFIEICRRLASYASLIQDFVAAPPFSVRA
jgi:hypothetical protein